MGAFQLYPPIPISLFNNMNRKMSDDENFICKYTAMPKPTNFIMNNNDNWLIDGNENEIGKTSRRKSLANKHYKPLNMERIAKNISKNNSKLTNYFSNESQQQISVGNMLKRNRHSSNINGLEDKNSTNSNSSDKDLFEQSQNDCFTDIYNS